MAVRKSGLGKGIDSLITDKIKSGNREENSENGKDLDNKPTLYLNINKVEPNREQPRKNFDEDTLHELSESIKQFGVLQPLLVHNKKGYFEIIAGERRWRAAKLAGLKEVPVIVKNLTDQEIVEISLIENIQRENLNPIEEAWAYKKLLTEFNLKQDEVADRVSKSRAAVTNSMRLLKLDERVQQMVIDDMISTGHARALLPLADNEKQFVIGQKIFDERLSVRDTEKLIKKMQSEKEQKKKDEDKVDQYNLIYADLEEKLKVVIGTKVTIHQKTKDSGKIEIEYYSLDDLERITDSMKLIPKN